MFSKFLMAVVLAGLAIPLAPPAAAQEPPATAQPAPPPNSALTARFTSFFKNVLAGHTPSSGVTDQVKQGLTPDLLAQIDGTFASLGKFKKLQFVRQDSGQGYQRYHYTAMFDNGTQDVLFVLDSNGLIAGFFKDSAAP